MIDLIEIARKVAAKYDALILDGAGSSEERHQVFFPHLTADEFQSLEASHKAFDRMMSE